jgi:hypothetical protein
MEYGKRMISVGKPWGVGLGGLLCACVVQADVSAPKDTPYKVILERNAFGLREIPPPTLASTNPPPAPPVNIKLTGVTTNSFGKKAWLMIPAAPPKSPNPQYLSLSEGEKQGEIEVLEINERETTVKILNAGVPASLNFKDNGLAAPAAPPVIPGAPGALPTPGGIPQPGIRTASVTPYAVPTPVHTVTPQSADTGNAMRTIPARNVRTMPIETVSQPQTQPQLAHQQGETDAAVQYIKMKVQEEQGKKEGIVLPPTPPAE